MGGVLREVVQGSLLPYQYGSCASHVATYMLLYLIVHRCTCRSLGLTHAACILLLLLFSLDTAFEIS